MIPRIFISSDNIKSDIATIEGSDVNYIKNVLRLNVKDGLAILDGKNNEYSAEIISISVDRVTAKLIGNKMVNSEPKVKVAIAQGIPKNPKMDLIIQKSTELGAFKIIPLVTERTVIRIHPEKEEGKRNRWHKIAKEAAEQSGRLIIPMVEEVTDFHDLFSQKNEYDLCIMLWEMEKERTIKKILKENSSIQKLLVLIGPEGGFSNQEAEHAKNEGFLTASIGSQILRTETAAISALSMIYYEFDL